MRKHLISAALLLAVLVPSVTAKVTPSARAAVPDQTQQVSPVPTQWRPQVKVIVLGGHFTLTRGEGFKTEDECKEFLASDEFRGELITIGMQALARDPDALIEGDPACVARSGPSDPA